MSAFDPSKLSFSPEEIEAGRKLILEYRPEPLTEEQIIAAQRKYYPKKTIGWVRDLYTNLNKPKTQISDEEILKRQEYYQTDPNELIERMSQLKNYFGMTGTEKFTLEHLAYARKHYEEDVGMHGFMKTFFDMITPETEEKFIELMNTLGI